MSWSTCQYCDGFADANFGELWLCKVHGAALEEHAGGLAQLLEMPPQARRCLADAILPRIIREEVTEPSVTYD